MWMVRSLNRLYFAGLVACNAGYKILTFDHQNNANIPNAPLKSGDIISNAHP
jgi:hypothetical protein